MDQKVCEASKRLNAIKYDADQKIDRLKELHASLRQIRIVDTRDIDLQRQQVCVFSVVSLDPISIKLDEFKKNNDKAPGILIHSNL